jgi:hypothetical protein
MSLLHINNLNCEFGYRIFAAGNYTLLYNILSAYDWSCMYETSVDVAVLSLNAAVRGAMEQEIPRGHSCKSNSPHWFSYTLMYYNIL